MKKRVLAFIMAMLMMCSACAQTEAEIHQISDAFHIYYLNNEYNEILPYEYELKAEDAEAMVEECIEQLSNSPKDKTYTAPIVSTIELKEYSLANGQLTMNFSENYLALNFVKEVLIRAAIVKTLVQIPGVDYITFYVEGAPLRDAKDNVVGVMSKDSFVNNLGEQINSMDNYDIVLYYASEDGTELVAEKRNIYAATNISMEKLVLTYLMNQPQKEGLQPVIPEGTKLISVATLDGVCFVNFDEKFLDYNYQLTEEVAFYAIINTLCEVTGVNKVQISINGETGIKYRDQFTLDKLYERNLDCIQKESN